MNFQIESISWLYLKNFFKWFDKEIKRTPRVFIDKNENVISGLLYTFHYKEDFNTIEEVFNYWKVNIAPEAMKNNDQ